MSDYTRIYLQPECCADPDVGRCWCPDDGPQDCPEGATWTPYILASEYDRLQAENEALRERVAELFETVIEFQREAWRALDADYVNRHMEASMKVLLGKAAQITGEVDPDDIEPSAFILRKQAEAVERAADKFGDIGIGRSPFRYELTLKLKEEAQRLLTQAAELERQSEGGE